MNIVVAGSPPLRRDPAFPELSVVRLTAGRIVGAVELPAGTEGTVVFVYQGGEAYEVEFFEPVATVQTVTAAELTQ